MELHRGRMESALVWLGAFLVAGALSCIAPASASNVAVSPVSVTLGNTPSALLTITNQGRDSVSFSLNTYVWTQGESGKIELTPTSDIIFFPALLTLAAGETRNVRIGTERKPAAVEKTYRIVLDELPPPRTLQSTHAGMQIQVLSRISVPIFIQPQTQRVVMEVGDLAVHKGSLEFRLHNAGSVHITPDVTVVGRDANARSLFSLGPKGVWYILADGSRSLTVPLPDKPCQSVRELEVSAQAQALVVRRSLQTPSGACAP